MNNEHKQTFNKRKEIPDEFILELAEVLTKRPREDESIFMPIKKETKVEAKKEKEGDK